MDANIWIITNEERQISSSSFQSLNPINGKLSGVNARNYFLKSNLSLSTLAIIWGLSDMDKDGALTLVEFTIAYKLVILSLKSVLLPRTLPPQLIQSATASVTSTAPLNFGSSSSSNLLSASLQQNLPPLTTSLSSSLLVNVQNLPNQTILSTPSFQPANSSISSAQQQKYTTLFYNCPDARMSGKVSGQHARPILLQSGLPNDVLARIWQQCDLDRDGFLSLEDFIKAMTLIENEKNNVNLAINLNSAKSIQPALNASAQQPNKAPVSFFGRRDDASSKMAEEFLEKQRKATQELLEKEREAAELFKKQELEKQRILECNKIFTNDLRKLTLNFESKIENDLFEIRDLKNKESLLTEQVAQLKLQIKQIDSLNNNIQQQQITKQNIQKAPIATIPQENQQKNLSAQRPSLLTQKKTTSNLDQFSTTQLTEKSPSIKSPSIKSPQPNSEFDQFFSQKSPSPDPFDTASQFPEFDQSFFQKSPKADPFVNTKQPADVDTLFSQKSPKADPFVNTKQPADIDTLFSQKSSKADPFVNTKQPADVDKLFAQKSPKADPFVNTKQLADVDQLFAQKSPKADPFVNANQSSNFDPFSLKSPSSVNKFDAQVKKSQDIFQPLPNRNNVVQSTGDLSTNYSNTAVSRPSVSSKPAIIGKDEINIKTVSNFELRFSSTQQTKGVNSRELNTNSSIPDSNPNNDLFKSVLPKSPNDQEAKKITPATFTADKPSIYRPSRNLPPVPNRPNRNKLSHYNTQDDPSSLSTQQPGSQSFDKIPSIPKKPRNYKNKQVEPAQITEPKLLITEPQWPNTESQWLNNESQWPNTEPGKNPLTYKFNESDTTNPPVKLRSQKTRNATIDSVVFPSDDPFSTVSSNQQLQDITHDTEELRIQPDKTKSEVNAESKEDNFITYDPPLLAVSIKPFQSKEISFGFRVGDALNITFKSGNFYYAEVNGIGDWFPVSSVKINNTPVKLSYDMSKFRLALYDNDIEEANDIEFREGDLITISKVKGDWGDGYSNGKIGVFPMNFVTHAEKFNTLESRTVLRKFEAYCDFEISLSPNTNVTILHKNQSGWCYGHAQNSSIVGCFHISCIDTSISEPPRSYPKGDN